MACVTLCAAIARFRHAVAATSKRLLSDSTSTWAPRNIGLMVMSSANMQPMAHMSASMRSQLPFQANVWGTKRMEARGNRRAGACTHRLPL
jgi:hypothetical protein